MHNVNIDTNISIVTHPVSGVCTLAVQWESMRIVCRRSWVQNLFASFLNPDQERYELVCFGMCWYVPVCFSMNWYELVCTDIYLLVTVYSSMYKYTHSPVSMRQYVLVCTGMYWYVLVCTSIYSDFQFTNSILPRYSIHGGTWKYMAVPESPVYLDYGGTSSLKVQGTWQYKALYLDVPLPTLKYRHNPGIQDFPVLSCTSMYFDVSSCIE